MPVAKCRFPVPRDDVGAALARLHVAAPPLDREAYTVEDLLEAVVRPIDALLAVEVHKRRSPLHGRRLHGRDQRDPNRRRARRARSLSNPRIPRACWRSLRSLGLATRANVCMARGLKTLVGFGTVRLRGDRRRHQLGQAARRRAARRRHVDARSSTARP